MDDAIPILQSILRFVILTFIVISLGVGVFIGHTLGAKR